MSDIEELRDAVLEALQANGTKKRLQASLRAEVYKILTQDDGRFGSGSTNPASTSTTVAGGVKKPECCVHNVVLNELIREYLEFNGLKQTASVFQLETNHPRTRDLPFDRTWLRESMGLADPEPYVSTTSSSTTGNTGAGGVIRGNRIPLMYTMLNQLTTQRESNELEDFDNNGAKQDLRASTEDFQYGNSSSASSASRANGGSGMGFEYSKH
eukprot:g4161.t1